MLFYFCFQLCFLCYLWVPYIFVQRIFASIRFYCNFQLLMRMFLTSHARRRLIRSSFYTIFLNVDLEYSIHIFYLHCLHRFLLIFPLFNEEIYFPSNKDNIMQIVVVDYIIHMKLTFNVKYLLDFCDNLLKFFNFYRGQKKELFHSMS